MNARRRGLGEALPAATSYCKWLKEQFIQKCNFSPYLIIFMLIESQSKFISPQNMFWSFPARQSCSVLLKQLKLMGSCYKNNPKTPQNG